MPVKYPDSVRLCVIQHYKAGHSMAAVVRLVGVSNDYVYRSLQKEGLIGLRPRKTGESKQKQIVELYSQGLSGSEVARRLSCTFETVVVCLRRSGLVSRTHTESMQGAGNPAWKGGRHTDKMGYVYLRAMDHPYVNNSGYVFEHRLVMEKHIGRYLLPKEVVHHKNKVRDDNRIENLELFASNAEHLAQELKGCVPQWTEDGIRRIREGHPGPGVPKGKYRPRSKTDDPQLPTLFDL